MKATEAKDLVVGRVYSDIAHLWGLSTILKYRGIEEARYAFDYVAGNKFYMSDKITFAKDVGLFYELTQSEIEQYLPKKKP